MKTYRVAWVYETEAESAEEAARYALGAFHAADNARPSFFVTPINAGGRPTGPAEAIDTDERQLRALAAKRHPHSHLFVTSDRLVRTVTLLDALAHAAGCTHYGSTQTKWSITTPVDSERFVQFVERLDIPAFLDTIGADRDGGVDADKRDESFLGNLKWVSPYWRQSLDDGRKVVYVDVDD